MRVLPARLQPALTWITGQPLSDETPWRLTPSHHLAASVLPTAAGIAASAAAVLAGGWWPAVLPLTWLMTVHGMRKLGSVILHQCTHGTYSHRRAVNAVLGHAIAVLLLVQEYADYSREHVADHHSTRHMTAYDPTARFVVLTMGCRPGMDRRRMWHAMFRTIASPVFHVRATYGRIASHLGRTAPGHRPAAICWLALQAAAIAYTGRWDVFLLAWVVPLTVLYNAAAVLRLSCRHLFPAAEDAPAGRCAIARGTHGIFLGERPPDPAVRGLRRAGSWTAWWLVMLLVHLPNRLFVLVGDGPCHDYHHRFPKSRDWVRYPFARRDDIAAGHPQWPAYTEVWGLRTAINEVFDSLRAADPAVYDPAALRSTTGPREPAPLLD